MSKHTPGPWEIVGRGVYQVDRVGGREVLHGSGMKGRGDPLEAEANTRLFAAAPDLLEACKAIMNSNRGEHLPAEKVGKMMEAIAKAEGEIS